jgi:hypothetical protein
MASDVETTRLLSAGTYLDAGFRDAVIDELYGHQERIVAPSVGFDAVRVLLHALRARRLQTYWAFSVVVLWVLGFLMAGAFFAYLAAPAVALFIAPVLAGAPIGMNPGRLRNRGRPMSRARRVLALSMSVTGGVLFAGYGGAAIANVVHPGLVPPGGDSVSAWFALAVPFAMTLCAAGHRAQVARILDADLKPGSFPRAADAVLKARPRLEAAAQQIQREQHSPLILYRTDSPFLGFGSPHRPWALAVGLRPIHDERPQALSNRLILDMVHPRIEALRLPAPHAASAGRDGLRQLAIDECVFLPVTGLSLRAAAPHDQQAFETHRAEALEESGTRRRHYLRIQLDSGGGGSVLTVFVRAHTQGGMLMLEFVPYVLRPVRSAFREVDRIADARRHEAAFDKALRALGQMPAFAARSVVHLVRQSVVGYRRRARGYGLSAVPDGPHASVRELGSDESASLFQEIDVQRWLMAVQDRVVDGVAEALQQAGYDYESHELEERVVNLAGGGVFIRGTMSGGAVSVSDHNIVTGPPSAGPRSPGPTTNPDDDSW